MLVCIVEVNKRILPPLCLQGDISQREREGGEREREKEREKAKLSKGGCSHESKGVGEG